MQQRALDNGWRLGRWTRRIKSLSIDCPHLLSKKILLAEWKQMRAGFFYELKFGMQIHQKNFDLGYDRGFFNRIIPPPKIPKLREIPIFALSFYFLRRGLQRKGA